MEIEDRHKGTQENNPLNFKYIKSYKKYRPNNYTVKVSTSVSNMKNYNIGTSHHRVSPTVLTSIIYNSKKEWN